MIKCEIYKSWVYLACSRNGNEVSVAAEESMSNRDRDRRGFESRVMVERPYKTMHDL